MDEQKLRIFNAISSFIQDLDTGFGKKYKPVALYNRLVSKTTLRDATAIGRHIKAFEVFFQINNNYISSKKLTEEAKIKYSERVYIDIGKILSKVDDDAHKPIYQHLITIFTLINIGTPEGQEALQTLKQETEEHPEELPTLNVPDTTEGKFIKDTFHEMLKHCEGMNSKEMNPQTMIAGMLQSGFFGKFMTELKTKFDSKEMSMDRLAAAMMTAVGGNLPGDSSNQLGAMMSQLPNLANLGSLMGNMPPEMSNLMGSIMNSSTTAKDSDEDKDSLSDTPKDDAD